MNRDESHPDIGGRYAKFALTILVVVYVFNFIDRQILSILAEEIQADLGISDSGIGFLYGTAFAVFYSVVGIPLGRLADVWTRKNLISIGLATWSFFTILSGTAKSFFFLAFCRIGVGIGESSASPSAYSLLSDYFSPKVRTTVLAIYSSGVYIGSGIGLFLGGAIVEYWNTLFPDPSMAPFGIRGWQAAFIAVGLPGLLLALVTWQIKEPKRGLSDGIETSQHPHPFKEMLKELIGLTPFSLMGQEKLAKNLVVNFSIALLIFTFCSFLTSRTGDIEQWVAFGIGCYFIACWIQSLRLRDPAIFSVIFRSKAHLFCLLGLPFIPFVQYAHGAFQPIFYLRNHGVEILEVGTVLGLFTAVGGLLGIVTGGLLGDKLREKYPNGRLYLIMGITFMIAPSSLLYLYVENLYYSYFWNFAFSFIAPMWLGLGVSTIADLVLPRMRAIAGAFFILMLSMLGMALGPYLTGEVSDILIAQGVDDGESIRTALALCTCVLVITIGCLLNACRYLPEEEKNKVEIARSYGEPI